MKTIKVNAKFSGTNGSCGFIKNNIYELVIYHKEDDTIQIRNSQGGVKWCAYNSLISFLENWTDVSVLNQSVADRLATDRNWNKELEINMNVSETFVSRIPIYRGCIDSSSDAITLGTPAKCNCTGRCRDIVGYKLQ